MNYKQLCAEAEQIGLYVYTYSPGDGKTRYIFSHDANSNYYNCYSLYVVLGIHEANLFFAGYTTAYRHCKDD